MIMAHGVKTSELQSLPFLDTSKADSAFFSFSPREGIFVTIYM
jgi:hypothetical protein